MEDTVMWKRSLVLMALVGLTACFGACLDVPGVDIYPPGPKRNQGLG